jgi:uncharacterized protein with GYD domain
MEVTTSGAYCALVNRMARRGGPVAKYLLKVSYTLDGIKGVKAQGGSARRTAAEEAAKSVGGGLESFYFAFGDTDVYIVADLPDNTAAAALAVAVGAGGGATVQTVVLLSAEEMDSASTRQVGYRPPGS